MGRRAYTLVELMIVVAMLSIIAAIAYPRVTDGLRRMRAREGAKAIVNAVLTARAQAMIRNVAHRVTLASSIGIGINTPGAGGTVTLERSSGPSCTALGTTFTVLEQYLFSGLGDVNLCLLRTTASPQVDNTTPCAAAVVQLCVTPDGTVTNLTTPAANNTLAYVREYEGSGGTVEPAGVVRQIVIPRRKAVRLLPIQVSNDLCL